MLIRTNQMQELDRSIKEKFLKALSIEIRNEFPRLKDVSEEVLFAGNSRLFDRALSYGLETESGVANFIFIALQFGAEFDLKFPAVHAILKEKSLNEFEKISSIDEMLNDILSLLSA